MALYLGDKKVKLHLDKVLYKLNLYSIMNRMRLSSADGYVLKDSNGLFLTVPTMNETMLLSADGYILKDSNGLFLTIKKESA
jgi:hypothetical protein